MIWGYHYFWKHHEPPIYLSYIMTWSDHRKTVAVWTLKIRRCCEVLCQLDLMTSRFLEQTVVSFPEKCGEFLQHGPSDSLDPIGAYQLWMFFPSPQGNQFIMPFLGLITPFITESGAHLVWMAHSYLCLLCRFVTFFLPVHAYIVAVCPMIAA